MEPSAPDSSLPITAAPPGLGRTDLRGIITFSTERGPHLSLVAKPGSGKTKNT